MNQFYILPPESVSINNECIIPGGKYNYPQKFNKKGSKTVKNDYFKKKKKHIQILSRLGLIPIFTVLAQKLRLAHVVHITYIARTA